MYQNITNDNKEIYIITKPGEHVFYFKNKTGTLTFDIQCEYATVKIYGLYKCKNSDKLMLNIIQKHSCSNSTSDVLIKSILYDKSTFNFMDTIDITKNATNSIAHLANYNLLLSTNAHVITSPQLEVIPNSVDCAHSSQTIPLDINQLNYLKARGITKMAAEKLLIDGFISEIAKMQR